MAQQPPAVETATKRYDVEMIRDFLDQLRLEVRLRMLEALRCALHPLSEGPIVARQRAVELLKKWQ